ncbi:MAG TPA: lactonase family protein [Thermoanaerobaculia bacterium]|nr:lactonase family protein [Thermoanaerobaculia bacterium]
MKNHHTATPTSGRRSAPFALTVLSALALLAANGARPAAPDAAAKGSVRIYVGTYTSGESKGIYPLRLNLGSGALTAEGEPTGTLNPSFLALHPNGRWLYAVNETGDQKGDPPGAVSAFAIDAATGALTYLGQQPSGGVAPCHLSLDRGGKHLVVANYGGGSVEVLPVQADGRLGAPSALVQHTGGGPPTPGRGPGPHAHYIELDAHDRFALVADLGRDEVMVYRFDKAKGTLTANQPPGLPLAPGSGPRHFAFDRDGRHVFVNNEIVSTVSVLGYDPDHGVLREVQTLSTLPAGFKGDNSTAEVALSGDGRFLYVSNRGHDSIAIFAIDAATRRLTLVGHQPTLGKTPRNFALDPTGRYLLVANQESDSVTVFRVDAKGGRLTPVGTPFHVPRPVCLLPVPLGR